MTDDEQRQLDLERRFREQYHEEPSHCGSHYCNGGMIVQQTAGYGKAPNYREIDCCMCEWISEADGDEQAEGDDFTEEGSE